MKNLFSTPNRKAVAALAVTAAVFVPLAVVGTPAFANGASPSASQYEYGTSTKVTVCHLTGSKKHPAVTISVAPSAVAAATKGGGHTGACTAADTHPRTHPAGSSSSHPNNGHHNGHP